MISRALILVRPVTATLLFVAALSGPFIAQASDYADAVSNWKSYQDVGAWLDKNFEFNTSRQKTIRKRLKKQGVSGLLIRNPETVFKDKSGYCADSAHFSLDALGKISPEYNPRLVFVMNSVPGKPNHWVTGFTVDGKVYVMDYGAGHNWDAMNGIHGPYDSLDGYKDFLASLSIRGFSVDFVKWRDWPGTVD